MVQLATGVVLDLPEDTPTFDVPHDFDPATTGPLTGATWRVLARRTGGEEFLIEEEWKGLQSRAPRWLLSIVEPTPSHRGEA